MPPKKRYEFPTQRDHIVQENEEDIAKSFAGDCVNVNAPGRKWFQHVWLWDADYTGDTTTKFLPETHGPAHSKQSPLPESSELQQHDMAVEMMEVGLVPADKPSKFHETVQGQTSRSKSRETAQKRRGTMTRNDTWFRAYIKVTDKIQTQAKAFIGCRFVDGHLLAITMPTKYILFYKEFYPGSHIKNVKEREAYINQAIKFYSARIKEPQPGTEVDKTASVASQALASEAAVAGHQMDRVQTEDQLSPYNNNDGVSIFLSFDKNITLDDEDMANLIETVQPRIGDSVQLQPELIRAIHEVMGACKIGEQTLGQLFPQSALALFLETCHVTIKVPYGIGSLIEGVHNAFKASQMHAKHSNGGKRKHGDMST